MVRICELLGGILRSIHFGAQAIDRRIETSHPAAQLIEISLREGRIERSQNVAAVDAITGLDVDLAYDRRFQRLYDQVWTCRGQFPLRRDDHLHLRNGCPGDREGNQSKHAVEGKTREPRRRLLLDFGCIRLEFGDHRRSPRHRPE